MRRAVLSLLQQPGCVFSVESQTSRLATILASTGCLTSLSSTRQSDAASFHLGPHVHQYGSSAASAPEITELKHSIEALATGTLRTPKLDVSPHPRIPSKSPPRPPALAPTYDHIRGVTHKKGTFRTIPGDMNHHALNPVRNTICVD